MVWVEEVKAFVHQEGHLPSFEVSGQACLPCAAGCTQLYFVVVVVVP